MDKYLGKKLEGRYEVMEIIGIGGMANVYKAYDVLENRVVAVKILQEEHMNNEDMRRRFKNESKAMAVLNHPNVMRVYDVSFSDRMQSIVMEYIDGITLKEYIEQQKVLRWKEAVHFTVQILRALQHAHDKGIVHRDIKPQNIMLLSDGTIKITDFGIARFARSETRTLTDKAIGSVHYISPEQAAGGAIDARTDLYAVGVILYEMLTGQVPFEADTPVSVALKQIQSTAVLPRELNPSIPEGLQEITMHAMEKELSKVYDAIDLVTTPDGSLVAMVHCNNCTSDLNAWVNLFKEYSEVMGMKVDMNELYGNLYRKALEGDDDCGGLLAYNYFSGEHVTGFNEGRPLFVRKPDAKFNLANFMRVHLFTSLGALKTGFDILFQEEKVEVDEILGHGGLFKTKGVGQSILAAAMNAPVSVMETAGEGGAWGIALLASYMINKDADESLAAFLDGKVFAGQKGEKLEPKASDVEGFNKFMKVYSAGLAIEKAAVESM